MPRPNKHASTGQVSACNSPTHAAVSDLLDRRLDKYYDSEIKKPTLSREEIGLRAVRGKPEGDERTYLGHRFRGANSQLAEEASQELVSIEERLGWSAEEARENEHRRRQRTAHEIVRQPGRVEQQTKLEHSFVWIVLGIGAASLFVAWNMVTANMLNSGLFPALMDFPGSLSLYLMSFAAVALSFLPKIHADHLCGEDERRAFVRALEIATAVSGGTWAVCVAVMFSPTADSGMAGLDLNFDAQAQSGFLGAVLLFSQLAAEVGMGALLWIFGLGLSEKGRLEAAHESPAYRTLTAEGNALLAERKALEEYGGRLRGFLKALEEVRESFVEEELGRIEAERDRHEGIRRLAIARELESCAEDTERELRVVS